MKEHRLAILKEEFIDDQPDITLTIEVELEEEGLFDVDTFTDPELALSSFKPGIYPLVILDIVMPKMDGFELYEELKRVDPHMKYVS
jgi:DNA-binding response OmpR family regulator